MRKKTTPVCALVLLFVSALPAPSQEGAKPAGANVPQHSERLQKIVDEAARAVLARFGGKGFSEKNLAISLVVLSDAERPLRAGFRGGEPIYPASVVKLFYLAAAHRW